MGRDSDPFMRNPPENGVTVYIVIDPKERVFIIKGFFRSNEITNFFDKPKNSKLYGIKEVVYWDDPSRRSLQKGYSDGKINPVTEEELRNGFGTIQ